MFKREDVSERQYRCISAVCDLLVYCVACGVYFELDEARYIRKEESCNRIYNPDVWCPNCGKCVMGPHQHEDNKPKIGGAA